LASKLKRERESNSGKVDLKVSGGLWAEVAEKEGNGKMCWYLRVNRRVNFGHYVVGLKRQPTNGKQDDYDEQHFDDLTIRARKKNKPKMD
jgi:hypothetical protein